MIDLDILQEPERLAALRTLALANLEPEEPFDRLTRLAAVICSAPTALIAFVDEDYEHFKSTRGLPEPLASMRQIPLSSSICQYVVASRQSLVVAPAVRQEALSSGWSGTTRRATPGPREPTCRPPGCTWRPRWGTASCMPWGGPAPS